jgi:hypothetical protein
MVLYLAVSPDRYGLPIAVADSARELERMLGLGRGTVISHISKVRHGTLRKQKYLKIEIDDEEELE